ncbi:hypothetical protein BRADI_3g35162v3 [Brachypodium distachyon]|uniref:Uncharacterized protein n=1 Tax=Brachypodium distachyon TaxID=15368 RepID=A0A2K2D186_BRADI|nr:hypothetical protein BRADI_3g35162v3 [Brachypodium distachyon]
MARQMCVNRNRPYLSRWHFANKTSNFFKCQHAVRITVFVLRVLVHSPPPQITTALLSQPHAALPPRQACADKHQPTRPNPAPASLSADARLNFSARCALRQR